MRTLFGGLLIAIGILIAGASGLCSLMLLGNGGGFDALNAVLWVLFCGGIPFAIGLGLVYAGRVVIRGDRSDHGDRSDRPQ